MKFIKLIALIILASLSLSVLAKKKKKNLQSQFGRNYRKLNPDASENPIHANYHTGSLTNPAPIAPTKYQQYNRLLSDGHDYKDTTGINAEYAKGHNHVRVRDD